MLTERFLRSREGKPQSENVPLSLCLRHITFTHVPLANESLEPCPDARSGQIALLMEFVAKFCNPLERREAKDTWNGEYHMIDHLPCFTSFLFASFTYAWCTQSIWTLGYFKVRAVHCCVSICRNPSVEKATYLHPSICKSSQSPLVSKLD